MRRERKAIDSFSRYKKPEYWPFAAIGASFEQVTLEVPQTDIHETWDFTEASYSEFIHETWDDTDPTFLEYLHETWAEGQIVIPVTRQADGAITPPQIPITVQQSLHGTQPYVTLYTSQYTPIAFELYFDAVYKIIAGVTSFSAAHIDSDGVRRTHTYQLSGSDTRTVTSSETVNFVYECTNCT